MQPMSSASTPSERTGGLPLARILWPIGLSLGVLALIAVFTLEPGTFGRIRDELDGTWVSFALLLVAARVVFGGWRLSHVSRGRLSFSAGIRGQLAWDFASNITPSLVGGAPLAAMFVARDTRLSGNDSSTVGEVGAFMLFVMLLDQLWFAFTAPVVLVAALFIEVIPDSLGSVGMVTSVAYLAVFMTWTAIFAYGTLFRPILLQRLLGRLFALRPLRPFRERAMLEMARYGEQAAHIRSQPARFFIVGFGLTAGTWFARYFLAVAVIGAVVPGLDVILTVLRSAAMALGSLVLPTPGGAGGIEGLYVLFFASLMPKAFVVPTLLAWRFLAYYLFVAVGIALSTHHVHRTMRNRRLENGASVAAGPPST